MMKKSKYLRIFITLLVFCCHYNFSNAQSIFVYSDHYNQGEKVEASISECSNLPDKMAGQVTSIDTRDNCARFYDAKNCSGSSIEVMPRSPSHSNLHFWGFNDKTVSVGPCPHMCDTSITGDVPDVDERVDLVIYNRKQFKGAYQELNVQGCTLIPTKFTRQLLSVKAFDKCLQFYNNVWCKHKGPNIDSIELRRGTPAHDDISKWWFPEARAVSHCSYKCNETIQDFFMNSNGSATPTKPNEVILFDEKNYAGNSISYFVESCMDILNDWEGAAVSIKTFNKSCVQLHEKRSCTGDSLNVVDSNPDLSVRSFDGVTRSMQPCSLMPTISQPKPSEGESDKDKTKEESADSSSSSSNISTLIISTIVLLPLAGVLISVILVLYIMKRCNPYKNIMEKLSEKEINEFLSGLGMDLANNGVKGDDPDGDYSAELIAQNRPYNEAYEILRSNIKFDPKIPLGMGEFGVVYRGFVQVMSVSDEDGTSKIKTIQVAVKTVKSGSSANCLRSLLKEVKIMLYVGKQDHIVQMVGCCTENLRKGEILVLMEFCPKGSLEGFLQKNREYYKNYVKKGRLDLTRMNNKEESDSTLSKSGYQNLEEGILQQFDFFQLLRWCIEIADGMEFLTSKKVIHSDLAARNVLLDDGFRAKISDFGLSRQLYCYTQYVKKRQEPLPWRWLAIESLKNLQFSSKSDVWSFGVLCWEIFTLGEKPYPGVVWSDDFLRNLQDGLRLSKPKYTVSECYNLMIQCWHDDPQNRPSFSDLRGELKDILIALKPPSSQAYSNLEYSLVVEV